MRILRIRQKSFYCSRRTSQKYLIIIGAKGLHEEYEDTRILVCMGIRLEQSSLFGEYAKKILPFIMENTPIESI
jgi:hypothetical protein